MEMRAAPVRGTLVSLRSCVVGCFMGIVPGGATPASFMSYGLAKKFSKDGDKFGTGVIEGVTAPETAAHAAGTSALLCAASKRVGEQQAPATP